MKRKKKTYGNGGNSLQSTLILLALLGTHTAIYVNRKENWIFGKRRKRRTIAQNYYCYSMALTITPKKREQIRRKFVIMNLWNERRCIHDDFTVIHYIIAMLKTISQPLNYLLYVIFYGIFTLNWLCTNNRMLFSFERRSYKI